MCVDQREWRSGEESAVQCFVALHCGSVTHSEQQSSTIFIFLSMTFNQPIWFMCTMLALGKASAFNFKIFIIRKYAVRELNLRTNGTWGIWIESFAQTHTKLQACASQHTTIYN